MGSDNPFMFTNHSIDDEVQPQRRVPRVPRISESWPHWKRRRSERRRRWTGGGSEKLTLTERTIVVKALIDSKMLVEIEADAVVNGSTA